MFSELPPHLAEMALFAVNTGCRDAEVCRMQWDWEVKVPALETFVFIVPGSFVKNGEERLVVLNDIAKRVVDSRRGKHPTHVFAYKGEPIQRMLNSAWCRVREKVGLKQVANRIWLVSFMHYDLGYFDDETCRLEPLNNPFAAKVLPMSPE